MLARWPSLVAEEGFGAFGSGFFSYIWTSNTIGWKV
jgi:hypothetical protein